MCLELIRHTYELFGFQYSLNLSTRPEKHMGDAASWDVAEARLREALDGTGERWSVDEGGGAFYGPKIDVTLRDALGRHHQTATIQLDFQLPQRFDLWYTTDSGEQKRPVIIHRAVLGSLERFFAILCEHTAGNWPLWLSPRQVGDFILLLTRYTCAALEVLKCFKLRKHLLHLFTVQFC